MPIIQAYTLQGTIIEKAKWEIPNFENLKENQHLQINFKFDDKKLSYYLGKNNMIIEKDKNKNNYSINLTFQISSFRHLLIPPNSLESMVIITAINRTNESILLYLMDKDKCDPRFINLVNQ